MGFWLFGRRKKQSTPIDVPEMGMSEARQLERARRDAGPETVPVLERKPSRKESQRRRPSSTRKLTKSNRSSAREFEKQESIPPVPAMRYGASGELTGVNEKSGLPVSSNTPNQQLTQTPIDRGDVPSYYFQNPMSASSLQPERFSGPQKPPTLLAKSGVNDTSLLRRKSSKRKAEDHAREREIKAMSATVPVPVRPSRFNDFSTVQDSVQPPNSDISLAVPESMLSSTSGVSDQHPPRLGLFEVLSPRPTIRYSENPRNSAASSSLGPSRTSTTKDKRPIVSQETVKASKRIDELADGLDSGTLRELMDRDRRRKENKNKLEQERLQRKLERKAQKQLQNSTTDQDVIAGPSRGRGTEPKPLGTVGLGIGGDTTRLVNDVRPTEGLLNEPPKSPETWLRDPSKDSKPYQPTDDPFQDPVLDIPTSHIGDPTPADEPDEPIIEIATAVRLSAASMSPPTSPTHHIKEPSNLSQLSISASRSTPDIPEYVAAERRGSDTTARLGGTWASFFRRGGTRARRDSGDRGRATPPGFSNTSRESITRQYPPSAFARSVRARSGTPVRTQSKFREDLPELPISPPDSRVQSPELPGQNRQVPQTDVQESTVSSPVELAASSVQPLSDIHPAFREEVALSRHQSVRSANSPEPTSALVAQSLASVDSEGSWLTGRPVKRSSHSPGNPLRESASSLQRRLQEFEEAECNVGVADEDGKAMKTPVSDMDETPLTEYPIGEPAETVESDDEIDAESLGNVARQSKSQGKLHSAIGRSPTIVQHASRAKSREGLLDEFVSGEDSNESSPAGDSPRGPVEYIKTRPGNAFIQRATSVELGKGHARHISAGSAKLLDLPRRPSGELKRLSGASGGPSPSPLSSPTFRKTETDTGTDTGG